MIILDCEFEADICMVVDKSGSISSSDFIEQMSFLRTFAAGVGNVEHERYHKQKTKKIEIKIYIVFKLNS